MNEEYFAAVGVFATFAVAVLVLVLVAIVIVDAVKHWLCSRSDLVKNVARLCEVQTALIKANNGLNERVKALEEESELMREVRNEQPQGN